MEVKTDKSPRIQSKAYKLGQKTRKDNEDLQVVDTLYPRWDPNNPVRRGKKKVKKDFTSDRVFFFDGYYDQYFGEKYEPSDECIPARIWPKHI